MTRRACQNDRLEPFCQDLAGIAGMDLVLPMNTGAEAVETAIKVARRWGQQVKDLPDGRAEITSPPATSTAARRPSSAPRPIRSPAAASAHSPPASALSPTGTPKPSATPSPTEPSPSCSNPYNGRPASSFRPPATTRATSAEPSHPNATITHRRPTESCPDDHRRADDRSGLADWFHWCGFTDVQPQKAGRSVQLSGKHLLVHLHSAGSTAGLPVVQRVQGQASVTARRAAVMSRAGFTSQALRWADDAGVALFELDRGSVPLPVSKAAAHLMPKPGELLPPDCTDYSCRLGCVLDSQADCPTDIGRKWSDPHSYLWRQVEPPSE